MAHGFRKIKRLTPSSTGRAFHPNWRQRAVRFPAPLDCRLELPADWRFLLVRPLAPAGASGAAEAAAHDQPQSCDPARTARMVAELNERLVPAAATGDFQAFTASLTRYGVWAGEFFTQRQAGLYNGRCRRNWCSN